MKTEIFSFRRINIILLNATLTIGRILHTEFGGLVNRLWSYSHFPDFYVVTSDFMPKLFSVNLSQITNIFIIFYFRVKQFFYGPNGNLFPHSFDVKFDELKVPNNDFLFFL